MSQTSHNPSACDIAPLFTGLAYFNRLAHFSCISVSTVLQPATEGKGKKKEKKRRKKKEKKEKKVETKSKLKKGPVVMACLFC